jgi:hypothetical protein
MSIDKLSPYVQVQVDTVVLRPGQTITIYANNRNGMKTQIEVRCLGFGGGNVGYPEIFCDDAEVVIKPFDEHREMEDAYRIMKGLPLEPKPATKKE